MTLFRSATLLFSLLCLSGGLSAQQTVFNVPTADVLDSGKIYFELDISAKANDSATVPRFSSFVPRLVVGVGGDIEIGLNVLGNIQPGADTTALSPTVKWRIYEGKRNVWAVAVGNNFVIPVRKHSYRLGTFSYVIVQRTFGKNTRVGFGGCLFSKDVVAPNATRAGAEFTFEHAVTKKLNINTDWITGKHTNGYFTSGVAYNQDGHGRSSLFPW